MSEITHARAILVDAPPDAVRVWVSDPLRLPNIYPNWLNKVRKIGQHGDGEAYEGVTPHGDKVKIIPKLGPKPGQAYFEIGDKDDNVEVFCTMVQPRKSGTKTILGYWWEGIDDAFWEGYKLGILDADLKHVKTVIERDANQEDAPRWYFGPPHDEAFTWLADSTKDGQIHIPTFVQHMLKQLRDVGLLHTPEDEQPANVRKVRLAKRGKQQHLWIRFDTHRNNAGYRNIEVIEAPRSDAAILG